MFLATEQYKERMMHHGTRRRISGTIGDISFTDDDVIANSLSISGTAAEESEMKIGGVYLGEIELSFVPSFLNKIDRDQYSGKELSIYIGLLIDPENDTWIDIPCGVFTLDEESPQISKNGIAVSGVDHMAKFDKKFNLDETSGTIFNYLTYACTACNVTLGMTEEEVEELPANGTELLGLYTPNDIETFRDLLYWVAQAAGCFACCDRYGRLVLRKFGNATDVIYDEDHRDDDVVFSGYTTKWTGISFIDIESQYTRYYGLDVDDGLTMNLGGNPLLQLGSADAVERRRRAVLNAVAEIQYTPFYCNSARDPIFDLGDEINFTGGMSGDCTGCIMTFGYAKDNFSFEGYGDKPSLTNARSKTDKNISGLMQSTIENEVTYYNFSNLEAFTFGSEQEISLAKLRFTSAQLTTVKIMHEFIFDMLADLSTEGSYEIHYYLDNELVAYSPYERIGGIFGGQSGTTELSICRDFFYILKDVEPNNAHIWEVKILAHGIDEVTIDTNHAHVTLEGQRLYGEEYFSGLIEASDELTIIPLGYLTLVSITDSAVISTPSASFGIASDNVGLYDIASLEVIPISEGAGASSPQIRLRGGAYINTEDHRRLCTEDGIRLITSR